ncbi:hypothetical protein SNOG_12093 [Parastagonospora nodorum SN15]|uniref:RanBP2-type domain-containing protein n=1 Tax=Phaeosphaeria nodorum (strain SN15 / ATCC MYA-4574 / FGSC 10173) TaxID=321614 RepID=Q0U821_PHANO|nr:hypothetical protein SNOG_12093 [Parastagonospora nodorum SN15]EAT80505.2 hypothetical protein SNOG_12093 [Parastagonospora nodorum SN15]
MVSTSSAAPAFGVLVDTEDTRRIQRLTKQGRHLEEEEYAQSVELREQFRLQVQRNPRMLHIYRHAFGCLEAVDMETKLLGTENREWREDVKAKRDAKDQRDRAMTAQDIKMRQDAKAEMLKKKAAEKAKYCGWSNARILIKCQKHLFGGGRCGVRKNDPAFTHEEQEEGPGIKFFQSSAKYIGDWRCSVCRWWHGTNVKNCRKCEKPVDECKDAEDWSNTLDPPNPHYMDSSRDFWNGNDREDAASLPHFQDAKYLGVAGKFKEKKNPYHLR